MLLLTHMTCNMNTHINHKLSTQQTNQIIEAFKHLIIIWQGIIKTIIGSNIHIDSEYILTRSKVS